MAIDGSIYDPADDKKPYEQRSKEISENCPIYKRMPVRYDPIAQKNLAAGFCPFIVDTKNHHPDSMRYKTWPDSKVLSEVLKSTHYTVVGTEEEMEARQIVKRTRSEDIDVRVKDYLDRLDFDGIRRTKYERASFIGREIHNRVASGRPTRLTHKISDILEDDRSFGFLEYLAKGEIEAIEGLHNEDPWDYLESYRYYPDNPISFDDALEYFDGDCKQLLPTVLALRDVKFVSRKEDYNLMCGSPPTMKSISITNRGLKAYKEMLDLREDSEEFVRRVEEGLGLERSAGD